jgi:hypothetical protein
MEGMWDTFQMQTGSRNQKTKNCNKRILHQRIIAFHSIVLEIANNFRRQKSYNVFIIHVHCCAAAVATPYMYLLCGNL